MLFILIKENCVGAKHVFGFIEAESVEKAAADPKVGLSIKERRGELYLLKTPSHGVVIPDEWFLQEVGPLMERPKELN